MTAASCCTVQMQLPSLKSARRQRRPEPFRISGANSTACMSIFQGLGFRAPQAAEHGGQPGPGRGGRHAGVHCVLPAGHGAAAHADGRPHLRRAAGRAPHHLAHGAPPRRTAGRPDMRLCLLGQGIECMLKSMVNSRPKLKVGSKQCTCASLPWVTPRTHSTRLWGLQEGMRGFYQGWLANTLKVAPQSSIRFVAYEALKALLAVQGARTDT